MRTLDMLVLIGLAVVLFWGIKIESDHNEFKSKVLKNAAFELEGRILRCGDIISNETGSKK